MMKLVENDRELLDTLVGVIWGGENVLLNAKYWIQFLFHTKNTKASVDEHAVILREVAESIRRVDPATSRRMTSLRVETDG